MTEKQLDQQTFLAALLLIVGCFGPMTDLAGLGNRSFYQLAEIPAYIVMVSAAGAVGMIFGNMRMLTLFAAIGAWLGALMPRFSVWRTDQEIGFLNKAGSIASDPMGYMAGDIFKHLNVLEWGGYCFFAGLVLLTLRSLVRKH